MESYYILSKAANIPLCHSMMKSFLENSDYHYIPDFVNRHFFTIAMQIL